MAMLCSGSHVSCELLTENEVDEEDFVYHEITLAENQHVYDNAQSVMSFALAKNGSVRTIEILCYRQRLENCGRRKRVDRHQLRTTQG
jgi:hypothetical protein